MVGSDDDGDKTVVLSGDSETLKTEKEKAKGQPARLVIIRGTPQGKSFEINKANMYLGRDASAEITVNDPNVSRKHALLTNENNAVQLQDNKSTNGTFLNDKRITQPTTLRKEDMIKVGNTILKYIPQGELEIFYLGSLESAAHTDPLTKIYNKGYIMEALEAEFKRAKALHQEFALVILDLDHFKKINDTHGHDAGDYVLKEVCALVRTRILPKDAIMGRFGGEEFLVLLPNMNLEAGSKVGEDVRSGLEKHEFKYEGKRMPVTASIGVAEMAVDVDNANALFKLADKAVYAAKSGGRNQVRTSS